MHLGHTGLAEAAGRAFGLERVWLWVNADPVHKTGITPYWQRLEMAKLATGNDELLTVYEGELSEAPHNVETFRALGERYPEAELLYIVGADTFAGIDRWDHVQSVVMNTTFLVAGRGSRRVQAVVDEVRERLGGLGRQLKVEVFEFEGYGGSSSLQVREQVRAGERPRDLDEQVYRYIVERGLYRG